MPVATSEWWQLAGHTVRNAHTLKFAYFTVHFPELRHNLGRLTRELRRTLVVKFKLPEEGVHWRISLFQHFQYITGCSSIDNSILWRLSVHWNLHGGVFYSDCVYCSHKVEIEGLLISHNILNGKIWNVEWGWDDGERCSSVKVNCVKFRVLSYQWIHVTENFLPFRPTLIHLLTLIHFLFKSYQKGCLLEVGM